ncbi:MAG TPA: hypothetical protein VIE66_21810, partial [Methylocella sp.]
MPENTDRKTEDEASIETDDFTREALGDAVEAWDDLAVRKAIMDRPKPFEPNSPSAATANGGAEIGCGKPRLLVDAVNPDVTVTELRDILAGSGQFYDRGVPVRVIVDPTQRGSVAQRMTPAALVLWAHKLARPYTIKIQPDGEVVEVDARLPRWAGAMYLEDRAEWQLPVLNGISSAPLLRDDGSIQAAVGYDANSGFWLENVPDIDTRRRLSDLFGRVFAPFVFSTRKRSNLRMVWMWSTSKRRRAWMRAHSSRCWVPSRRWWKLVGVVSGLLNPNGSSVGPLDRRPRHDEGYHEGGGCRRR